ncbi:MAG: fluoride efflux transporter FluC [Acidimicrobiales bacterium]
MIILILLFVVAAAAGASLRAVSNQVANTIHFPYGTLTVNLIASFALGAVSGAEWGGPWPTVFGVAGLGALSTWSTLANEAATMARERQGGIALLYVTLSCTAGVLAAWFGLQVTG